MNHVRNLYNGNWWPESHDAPHGCEFREITIEGETHDAIVNVSEGEVMIKPGYNTTANGRCDDLELYPGEAIIMISPGSGYSFAKYSVFEI